MPPIPTNVWILALIVVLLPLLPYVLGPFLIHSNLKQSAKPKVGTFPLDDPNLPKKVAGFFKRTTEALAPLGFKPVGGLTLPNQTPRVQAIALMYSQPKDKVVALASAMFTKEEGKTKLKTTYVEIVTRFLDDTIVQTNNSDVLGAFKRRKHIITTQFPEVEEADRLYQLHRQLEQRHGGRVGKIMPLVTEFDGDAAAFLAHAIVQEVEGQIGTGYFYLAEEEEVFRPTWKGALMMTWSQLWPFKAMAIAKRNKKARELLAELEGEAPEDA